MATIKRETTKEFMKKARKIKEAVNMSGEVAAITLESANKIVPVNFTFAPVTLHTLEFTVEGTTPLLVNNFGPKSRQQMLDSMQPSKTKAAKGAAPRKDKDPEEEYNNAFYRLEDGRPGFPLLGLKAAAISALTSNNPKLSRPVARQMFFIMNDEEGGELTPVYHPNKVGPVMRQDRVRIMLGKPDLRHRPEFKKWGIKFSVRFNPAHITAEQMAQLISHSGQTVGIGEWRPEKGGSHGTYLVVNEFSWE